MRPLRTTLTILITVAAVLAVRAWLIEPIYIASDSMAPTLTKGQHLFLDKFTYRFRSPERGEVISFFSPVGEDHESVKRVIAVAGDTVELRQKKVYLNGEPQYESYAWYARAGEALKGDTMPPVKVPEGALFVLGDNRDNSNDSASWTDPATGAPPLFLRVSAVTGKVRGVY
jgi:signal peptidase I